MARLESHRRSVLAWLSRRSVGGALGGSVGTAMAWWWQNIDTENDYGVYTALGNILNRTGWGRGPWTNIVFGAGSLSANSIGQSGAHESLIYCTASDANYPNGATNNLLPIQQEQTVTLTHWKAGSYYVAWFDPGTATPMGSSSSTTTNGNLTLPTPNFSVDLAGVVYPVPQLTVLGSSSNGWQFRLDSETDGEYLIQSSTNLADWTAYMAITNSTGGIVIDTPLPATNETIFFELFSSGSKNTSFGGYSVHKHGANKVTHDPNRTLKRHQP